MQNIVVIIDRASYTCLCSANEVLACKRSPAIAIRLPIRIRAKCRQLICKMQRIFVSIVEFVAANATLPMQSTMWLTSPSSMSSRSEHSLDKENLLKPPYTHIHSFGRGMNQNLHMIPVPNRTIGVYL